MNSYQFHDEKKDAAGRGERLAYVLNCPDHSWLDAHDKAEVKTLLTLIDSFQKKASMRTPIPREDIVAVNQILKRYTWRVELTDVKPLVPCKGVKKEPIAFLAWKDIPIDPLNIGWVTKDIITIARHRLLDRIRQCKHCKQWFYAKYEGKEYCKPACQINAWRETEQGKKSTRAAQKKHYKKWSSELEEFRSWKKKKESKRRGRKS